MNQRDIIASIYVFYLTSPIDAIIIVVNVGIGVAASRSIRINPAFGNWSASFAFAKYFARVFRIGADRLQAFFHNIWIEGHRSIAYLIGEFSYCRPGHFIALLR